MKKPPFDPLWPAQRPPTTSPFIRVNCAGWLRCGRSPRSAEASRDISSSGFRS